MQNRSEPPRDVIASARMIAGNPDQHAGNKSLFLTAWLVLKSAQGRPVDQTRLGMVAGQAQAPALP